MNIFILSGDPVEAAQMQCDKHTVKMIVESAQMLSTAHRVLDGKMVKEPSKSGKSTVKNWKLHSGNPKEDLLYKVVHINHPCTVWTMKTKSNYIWHYNHFIALCDEYTYRYDKIHATDVLLRQLLKSAPYSIADGTITPFALAMNANPECIFPNDPIKSYRQYYQTKQDRFKMKWTKRTPPEWFIFKSCVDSDTVLV